MLLGDIYNNMGVLFGMVEQFELGREYFALSLEKYVILFGKDHQLCREVEANICEIDKLITNNKKE